MSGRWVTCRLADRAALLCQWRQDFASAGAPLPTLITMTAALSLLSTSRGEEDRDIIPACRRCITGLVGVLERPEEGGTVLSNNTVAELLGILKNASAFAPYAPLHSLVRQLSERTTSMQFSSWKPKALVAALHAIAKTGWSRHQEHPGLGTGLHEDHSPHHPSRNDGDRVAPRMASLELVPTITALLDHQLPQLDAKDIALTLHALNALGLLHERQTVRGGASFVERVSARARVLHGTMNPRSQRMVAAVLTDLSSSSATVTSVSPVPCDRHSATRCDPDSTGVFASHSVPPGRPKAVAETSPRRMALLSLMGHCFADAKAGTDFCLLLAREVHNLSTMEVLQLLEQMAPPHVVSSTSATLLLEQRVLDAYGSAQKRAGTANDHTSVNDKSREWAHQILLSQLPSRQLSVDDVQRLLPLLAVNTVWLAPSLLIPPVQRAVTALAHESGGSSRLLTPHVCARLLACLGFLLPLLLDPQLSPTRGANEMEDAPVVHTSTEAVLAVWKLASSLWGTGSMDIKLGVEAAAVALAVDFLERRDQQGGLAVALSSPEQCETASMIPMILTTWRSELETVIERWPLHQRQRESLRCIMLLCTVPPAFAPQESAPQTPNTAASVPQSGVHCSCADRLLSACVAHLKKSGFTPASVSEGTVVDLLKCIGDKGGIGESEAGMTAVPLAAASSNVCRSPSHVQATSRSRMTAQWRRHFVWTELGPAFLASTAKLSVDGVVRLLELQGAQNMPLEPTLVDQFMRAFMGSDPDTLRECHYAAMKLILDRSKDPTSILVLLFSRQPLRGSVFMETISAPVELLLRLLECCEQSALAARYSMVAVVMERLAFSCAQRVSTMEDLVIAASALASPTRPGRSELRASIMQRAAALAESSNNRVRALLLVVLDQSAANAAELLSLDDELVRHFRRGPQLAPGKGPTSRPETVTPLNVTAMRH